MITFLKLYVWESHEELNEGAIHMHHFILVHYVIDDKKDHLDFYRIEFGLTMNKGQ